MKKTNGGLLLLLVLSGSVAVAQTPLSITVDCSSGQSLNRALAKLDKHVSVTVSVNGTCTEYVQVTGFDNLTVKGLPGAMLMQPSTGAGNLFNSLLLIEASRSVTVNGLDVQADTATVAAIGIGHGSSDIRLRNLNVTGGSAGITVFENSQVSIAHVTVQNSGYATLAIFDLSDVHAEHCIFKDTTGTQWHSGIFMGASHITMFDTTIRNMQVAIDAGAGSIVDVGRYTTYTPSGGPSDIIIESPAGTNFNGVSLDAGSSLNISSARLLINQSGQSWGGTSGGVLVSHGSTLNANGSNLIITGSHGQGIVVVDNSHATLMGASITGSGHAGLVVDNLSSVDVSGGTPALIGGNAVDLFCDSGSMITGGSHLAGAPTSECANVQAGEASLP